ncbi:MAG: hypothetical protein U5K31_04405 [Balneolaceae bacterium]|nr:hypothetical protein [Balneolaceae bacterium]
MSRYHLIYLIWLLPAYLLFLCIHQVTVYNGVVDTFENGKTYTAEVVEFELKQIAAQTNGYVVLRFQTGQEQVQRRLSLPVEMAASLQETAVIPVRYRPDAFQEIVMVPTYNTQKGLALTNMGMALVGFLITLPIAWIAHRFAGRSIAGGEEQLVIERIDRDE